MEKTALISLIGTIKSSRSEFGKLVDYYYYNPQAIQDEYNAKFLRLWQLASWAKLFESVNDEIDINRLDNPKENLQEYSNLLNEQLDTAISRFADENNQPIWVENGELYARWILVRYWQHLNGGKIPSLKELSLYLWYDLNLWKNKLNAKFSTIEKLTPKIIEDVKERIIREEIPKLLWEGSAKQLYDVVRQLKNQNMVVNSNEELAEIVFRIVKFKDQSPSRSTIRTELSRKDNSARPMKAKRLGLSDKE